MRLVTGDGGHPRFELISELLAEPPPAGMLKPLSRHRLVIRYPDGRERVLAAMRRAVVAPDGTDAEKAVPGASVASWVSLGREAWLEEAWWPHVRTHKAYSDPGRLLNTAKNRDAVGMAAREHLRKAVREDQGASHFDATHAAVFCPGPLTDPSDAERPSIHLDPDRYASRPTLVMETNFMVWKVLGLVDDAPMLQVRKKENDAGGHLLDSSVGELLEPWLGRTLSKDHRQGEVNLSADTRTPQTDGGTFGSFLQNHKVLLPDVPGLQGFGLAIDTPQTQRFDHVVTRTLAFGDEVVAGEHKDGRKFLLLHFMDPHSGVQVYVAQYDSEASPRIAVSYGDAVGVTVQAGRSMTVYQVPARPVGVQGTAHQFLTLATEGKALLRHAGTVLMATPDHSWTPDDGTVPTRSESKLAFQNAVNAVRNLD